MKIIERTTALIDLACSVVFLLVVVRVYRWIDEILVLVSQ